MKDETAAALTFWVVVVFVIWLFLFDGLHSKYRYAAEYNVLSEQVFVSQKPHDCEWGAAPVGNKYCHYEADVTSLLTSTNKQGNPIYSNDAGKTWVQDLNIPRLKSSVYVEWQRISD